MNITINLLLKSGINLKAYKHYQHKILTFLFALLNIFIYQKKKNNI